MLTARNKGRLAITAAAVGAALALSGCAQGDPLDSGSDGGETEAIVIGSQAYYSNEIIAEIYAQALEDGGYEVERKFNIGQREAYMPSIEDGSIDLFPEYTGSVVRYFDEDAEATLPDEVYTELEGVLPEGITPLEYSEAADKDAYNVTAAYAEEHGLVAIPDLEKVGGTIRVGGAPELEERTYGPSRLAEEYGIDVQFEPTADTTVESLAEGAIDVANVYTADPSIAINDFVTLEDPDGLIPAANVVPLASDKLDADAIAIIDAISAEMDTEQLVALNVQSVQDQESPDAIATAWLTEHGLLG
ncbi:ABC transporter substrate-binding protein [Homoserinibacter sp. YIM 151385]|uniref:ABC transporter substrate-binding protein n=1 Tax=Homoserinibacter sp. YIM 151385 TaxID=2985506 RepID=UPI0022F073AB|nr:ABC transporter substrate-binding protein [Homoserinibacter sp. YIM 151385]WBU38952.1 ABC transporter substrate-binding protein [Homoserinibacter sp. YIM 151385]